VKPTDAALLPAGVRAVPVTTWRNAQSREHSDWLADEVPVALVFNGISHAVMLASPTDLDDFALGFGLTEGLLASASELLGVVAREVPDGIELQLEVTAACAWRLKERRRTLVGVTGCGLFGAESLSQVRRELPRAVACPLEPQALTRAQRELQCSQAMHKLTGATHAAAWCAADGRVLLVREDVGRHIALDKLVGAMVRSAANPAEGFICVTSRASFEMVQKTAMAGVATLAAVSAPTALAVDAARSCGLALAGFVRGEGLVAYTFAERLGLCEAPRAGERR
jgi:FdhD protein